MAQDKISHRWGKKTRTEPKEDVRKGTANAEKHHVPSMGACPHMLGLSRETANEGLAPTAAWRTLDQATAHPFPPSPIPLPPTPLALFVMLWGGDARAGVRQGSKAAGGWRGRALQPALGDRPT